MDVNLWLALLIALVSAVLAATAAGAFTWSYARSRNRIALAELTAQRDALIVERDAANDQARVWSERFAESSQADRALAPLAAALTRVERQVGVLERDRVEQFGELGERLGQVHAGTAALREQTAALAGALNSTTIRGSWGETQLRRVLEHAGMMAHCDFDEQVSAVTDHDARVRPDVLVHLPQERHLVIDAKAPMTHFLAAQRRTITPEETEKARAAHGAALRRHVDQLADKRYWTAFTTTPEMVICYLPADAILAAALDADPGLFDHAQGRRVVLASPSTLLALLRTVALVWQQDSLTENAKELLTLGSELYSRLATLGDRVDSLGGSLRRAVEGYNAMVGSLENRVLVTARRLSTMDATRTELPTPPPLTVVPRPLTAEELLPESHGQGAGSASSVRYVGQAMDRGVEESPHLLDGRLGEMSGGMIRGDGGVGRA